jgi:hypothetical protein
VSIKPAAAQTTLIVLTCVIVNAATLYRQCANSAQPPVSLLLAFGSTILSFFARF